MAPRITAGARLYGAPGLEDPHIDWAAYRDPHTTDTYIISAGIGTKAIFDAIQAREDKSVRVVDLLVDFAIDVAHIYYADGVAMLLSLMGEPNLGREHLLDMTALLGVNATGEALSVSKLLPALCGHPAADNEILVIALWTAGQRTCAQIATSSGKLMVAVIAWEHRRNLAGGYLSVKTWARLYGTHTRWANWAADTPLRKTFLLTASFRVDTLSEKDLLDAGAAITATSS